MATAKKNTAKTKTTESTVQLRVKKAAIVDESNESDKESSIGKSVGDLLGGIAQKKAKLSTSSENSVEETKIEPEDIDGALSEASAAEAPALQHLAAPVHWRSVVEVDVKVAKQQVGAARRCTSTHHNLQAFWITSELGGCGNELQSCFRDLFYVLRHLKSAAWRADAKEVG